MNKKHLNKNGLSKPVVLCCMDRERIWTSMISEPFPGLTAEHNKAPRFLAVTISFVHLENKHTSF